MNIIIGSARSDERGKLSGGSAGDQKQKTVDDYSGEVSLQKFYNHSKGWYVLRAKDKAIADKLADAMIIACNNSNIGYDQNQRLGVISKGVSTQEKTEADCSSLVRACCIYAGFDPSNFTTANEASVLAKTGKFEDKFKYTSKTALKRGDILVTCTKGHTVIVCKADEAVKAVETYPRYEGSSCSIVSVLIAIGEKDTSFSHRNKIANANGIAVYNGTAIQNLKLVQLAKDGKLIKG